MFDFDNKSSRNRTNFSLSAVLAIFLGIIFLLNNFNFLPWEIWQNLWKFWPVLLILFGSEIMLGKSVATKSLVFLLGLIFLLPILLIINPLTGNPLANEKINLDKPLGNLTKTEFLFNLSSVNLNFGALDENSSKVFVGTMTYSTLLPKPTVKEESKFGQAKFSFEQQNKNLFFLDNLGNSVNLKISRFIPYEISLKANTANLKFDFSKIRLDLLNVDTKAGKFELILSKDYSAKIYLKNAAGFVSIKIPNDLGVNFKTDSQIRQVNLPKSRFDQFGNNYKSKNYEISPNKVEIEVIGPLSSVEIKS